MLQFGMQVGRQLKVLLLPVYVSCSLPADIRNAMVGMLTGMAMEATAYSTPCLMPVFSWAQQVIQLSTDSSKLAVIQLYQQ